MKHFIIITLCLIVIGSALSPAKAQNFIQPHHEVVICPATGEEALPPTFSEPLCRQFALSDIDPQDTSLWVKLQLTIPQGQLRMDQPYGIYLFGKTSSRVYFNGHYLGRNGTPSDVIKREFPGKMDSVFYIPPALLTSTENSLILHLSSHHGFLTLDHPINFIGIAPYANPQSFFQRDLWLSIIPLGALILGAIYFAVISFTSDRRSSHFLFFLMCSLAGGQLLAELSRALTNYSYPLHDLRLLLIVSLAILFGLCLLWYVVRKFAPHQMFNWIIGSGIVTLIAVIGSPGYDGKTVIAILVPAFFSTTLLVVRAFALRTKTLWWHFGVFSLFSLTILLTFSHYHDSTFYYFITAILFFLFIQQALEINDERRKRRTEELQVARLRFKLDQNIQATKPYKIKISQAGKITLVSTNTITYCKAAGDYVELYFEDQHQQLYSGSMKELSGHLPNTFLRVHRSYVVNTDFISSLSSSSSYLQLTNGEKIPVSRRTMPVVRSAIDL